MPNEIDALATRIRRTKTARRFGKVTSIRPGSIGVRGLSVSARIGDLVGIGADPDGVASGEIIAVGQDIATVMPYRTDARIGVDDTVELLFDRGLFPCDAWMGRLLDAHGKPYDHKPLPEGDKPRHLQAQPPAPSDRKLLGPRIRTGLAGIDTLLPIVQGQRVGIFAGSGVGKTSLLANLARAADADVIVIGLIGERGREIREFIERTLGPEGLARSVVIAATSDQSPLLKRRAAWTALAIAEHFRDSGRQAFLILDSITRFAEAHREIALTAGEPPSLRAYPPSTAHALASLTERAGCGAENQGDITAVFSVLVAGSDMDEPIADITRGLLDGHIVLDREIAERGRFPAIDLNKSVSRALPNCASPDENTLILEARKLLATYEASEAMIKAGLYTSGANADLDRAISIWRELDTFLSEASETGTETSFARLAAILGSPAAPVDAGYGVTMT